MSSTALAQKPPHPEPLCFDVPGEPIAQHRPRFAGAGQGVERSGHVYSEQMYDKSLWQASARISMPDRTPFAGPLSLRCVFYFPLPRKHIKRYRAAERIYLQKAPQNTSYLKWVEDCLNGIAWRDDRQIEEHYYRKEYCLPGEERTSIKIVSLNDESDWIMPALLPDQATEVYELPGIPRAQERPRFFSNATGRPHAMNPQKRERAYTQLYARTNLPPRETIRGPIRVCSIFNLPLPRECTSLYKNGSRLYVQDEPDLSNYQKWFEYCLEGISWEKNAQIEENYCRRQYCMPGCERTTYAVTQIENEEYQSVI